MDSEEVVFSSWCLCFPYIYLIVIHSLPPVCQTRKFRKQIPIQATHDAWALDDEHRDGKHDGEVVCLGNRKEKRTGKRKRSRNSLTREYRITLPYYLIRDADVTQTQT